jgi:peptidoglycan hydrolase-like protein with peptidoglycan-binding domain
MARRKKKSAMTATTFTRLPLQAGSAVATSMGRFGIWTLTHYMRAPLASTGLLAMVTLTALAGSNALYFQTARHPAPMFAPSPLVPETANVASPQQLVLPDPVPVQQTAVTQMVTNETTGSVSPAAVPTDPVGNKDVFAVQKKLTELGLFSGTVDGYYGPMTARAIRAFEERNGMTPMGAVSRDVIDAILRADAAGMVPVVVQAAAVAPPPAVVAPQPVAAPVQAVAQSGDRVVARLPAIAPAENVVDTVGNAAAQTIDSIVAAVEGGRQTPAAPAVKPVPAMPLMATNVQPMPAPVQQVASLETIVPKREVAAVVPDEVRAANVRPANDTQLVSQVQRGLASLGFFHAPIDGKPGEATAKAIRSFEVFHNYQMTGQVTPELPGLLRAAGADI